MNFDLISKMALQSRFEASAVKQKQTAALRYLGWKAAVCYCF